jgi:hypothetical protein
MPVIRKPLNTKKQFTPQPPGATYRLTSRLPKCSWMTSRTAIARKPSSRFSRSIGIDRPA